MLNVAILGLGFMGLTHLKAWLRIPGIKIVALSDQNPLRARGDFTGVWSNLGDGAADLSASLAGVTGSTDWREILTLAQVDIVDICLPTPAHAEASIAALQAGKHVLCEKPLGRDLAEVQSVARVAAEANGLFMPAMCMRFWPQWTWLKKAVEQKTYGPVRSAAFRRVASTPPGWFTDGTLSGGGILDIHVHDTDFIYFLFGTPRSVASRGYSGASGKVDHLITEYAYDDIPLVYAEGGWCHDKSFPFTMRYTVNFQHATADFDISRPDSLMLAHNGTWSPVKCQGGEGYDHELRYFIDCIQTKSPPTLVSIADALESTRILQAESRSIELARPVEL